MFVPIAVISTLQARSSPLTTAVDLVYEKLTLSPFLWNTEIADYGYPQKTDTAILKTFITQQGIKTQVIQFCFPFLKNIKLPFKRGSMSMMTTIQEGPNIGMNVLTTVAETLVCPPRLVLCFFCSVSKNLDVFLGFSILRKTNIKTLHCLQVCVVIQFYPCNKLVFFFCSGVW